MSRCTTPPAGSRAPKRPAAPPGQHVEVFRDGVALSPGGTATSTTRDEWMAREDDD